MIPDSFVQQLKQSSDIESVIASYHVKLTKKGRTSVGLCPFHSEKSGSFYVYPQTQSFYCFGCGAGGDVISFLRKIENIEYVEALRLLAKKSGVAFPEEGLDDKASRTKTRILELNREVARFYHQCLVSDPSSQAYQYLLKRGRTPKMMTRFGLGYSPNDWDSVLAHLRSKGFSQEELLASGVAVRSKNGGLYDRFRHRVIFPIIDLRGSVIAFGGRALEEKGPKYLNSADTPVFKKSRNLFALNFAKTSKANSLILAEGYMDVIALHQAGFDNAVATLGTSLTQEQARLLGQYTEQVVLAYDSDHAGQTATRRAINIFSELGIRVNVLSMPGAKDPDEWIQTYGAQRFQMLLDGCSNALEFEISKLREKYDLALPDGKVNFLKDFCKLLAGVHSPVERGVYLAQISQELAVNPAAIQAQIDTIHKAQQRSQKKKERNDTNIYVGNLAAAQNDLQRKQNLRCAVAEEGILYCLMKNPDFLPKLEAKLEAQAFRVDCNREILAVLSRRIHAGEPTDLLFLSEELSQDAMARLAGVMACAPSARSGEEELYDCIKIISEQQQIKSDKEVREMNETELKEYIHTLAEKKK